ncbi:salicylate hydroxylase [Macrolepiota fuliginosa MF-IS2]|uniref:Salicylate hydroxylase n=1 Tax=Macrolepiota fuliginosa MF-IS2 TaxID=1400762 RepID=A0A9P6BZ31_9AGAR|nr:salicylate hydroxylase [Macrolepiota fuliginosa MF-IS2]
MRGGGIGGLTLAAAIGQLDHGHDIEIHLYEAAPKLGEIGAGLTIFNRTWELLATLGCREAIKKRAFTYSRMGSREIKNDAIFQMRKSDQKDGFTFLNLTVPGGSWSIHRADLHQALLARLPENSRVHLASRVVTCTQHGSFVTITLHDGKTANFDLVIGADGIKSVIRQELIAELPDQKDCVHPIWTGSIGYRSLIPMETLARKYPGHRAITAPIMYCGKNKHIVTYPISKGRLINTIAFFSEPEKEGTPFPGEVVQEASQNEVLSRFGGWEDEVMELLKSIDKSSRWAILASKPLSTYGTGRVAVLGDAAHAMTTHLGSGAGQAIEDAYILASVITMGVQDGIDVARIIEIYSTVRQPMGNFVLNSSRSQGLRYELNSIGFEDVRENEPIQMDRMIGLAEEIIRGWKWSWTTSVQEDQKRAKALL